MKKFLMLCSLLLPWGIRRGFLEKQFGYQLHETSRIGLSFILPERLVMEAGARIGHLNVCKGIALLQLGEHSSIGNLNWITGFPRGGARHFVEETDRVPQLLIGPHSAITHRQLIDCTNTVTIGKFTTFAGFQSQILTHSIDLARNRQASAAVRIGDYCFVGTNSVILGGSALPDYSVLGAKSLLNKSFTETHQLYAGVPAKSVQTLPSDYEYFRRTEGFVV